MDSTQFDTLIIGQGLAGSLLAWRLLARGQRVLVVDDGARSSASRTAAGLLNPVTGQRLVLHPEADTLLPAASRLYAELAAEFGRPFFHPLGVRRLFQSQQERELWQRRLAEPAYRPYLDEAWAAGASGLPLADPRGGFFQHHTGYLDTDGLLDALREYLRARDGYVEAAFDYAELQLDGEGVRWRGVHAGRAVFCEGYRLLDNPWFDWLPLQPAKGEILTLATAAPLPGEIIKGAKWLLPLPGGRCRLGATYQWQPIDCEPSAAGREALLGALGELFDPSPEVEVLEQRAGVRPGTRDKAPFLGFHPRQRQLGVCNGFGSKGTMLVPWHVERLAAHLLDGAPLPAAADIAHIKC